MPITRFVHQRHSAQHGGRIEPTADTGALIGEAVRMLRPLWRQGFRYLKDGVVLDDLRDEPAAPAIWGTHWARLWCTNRMMGSERLL